MITRTIVLGFLLCLVSVIALDGAQRGVPRSLLEVELVIALADDEQLRDWAMDAPGASFDSATEVRPGQPAIAQARVRGCMLGESGRCDVVVQYTVTAPDGTTVRHEPARPVEEGKSAPTLRLTLSKTDQVGLYRVAAVVRDSHARRVVRTERIFGLRVE